MKILVERHCKWCSSKLLPIMPANKAVACPHCDAVGACRPNGQGRCTHCAEMASKG